MEIPQGKPENSGKQNPKTGFKSPPEQRRKSGVQHLQQFCDFLIDFGH